MLLLIDLSKSLLVDLSFDSLPIMDLRGLVRRLNRSGIEVHMVLYVLSKVTQVPILSHLDLVRLHD